MSLFVPLGGKGQTLEETFDCIPNKLIRILDDVPYVPLSPSSLSYWNCGGWRICSPLIEVLEGFIQHLKYLSLVPLCHYPPFKLHVAGPHLKIPMGNLKKKNGWTYRSLPSSLWLPPFVIFVGGKLEGLVWGMKGFAAEFHFTIVFSLEYVWRAH